MRSPPRSLSVIRATEKGLDSEFGRALRDAKKGSDPEIKKWLAKNGRERQVDCSELLYVAASNGRLSTVRLLLPWSDPGYRDSVALKHAATQGYLGIVRLLLPLSHPAADYSAALKGAAENGHAEVVALLLPHSPRTEITDALCAAVAGDHEAVVLRVVSQDNSMKFIDADVLHAAFDVDSPNMLNVLLTHSKPSVVRTAFNDLLRSERWKEADQLASHLPEGALIQVSKTALAHLPAVRSRRAAIALGRLLPEESVKKPTGRPRHRL